MRTIGAATFVIRNCAIGRRQGNAPLASARLGMTGTPEARVRERATIPSNEVAAGLSRYRDKADPPNPQIDLSEP
jgi:hypothetical protein